MSLSARPKNDAAINNRAAIGSIIDNFIFIPASLRYILYIDKNGETNKKLHHNRVYFSQYLNKGVSMKRRIKGSCLCGTVKFDVIDDFKRFYFCHCQQCRKLTSSAHASNLFALPTEIRWLKGEANTQRYDHPDRLFVRVFCKTCGCGLPMKTQNGKFMIVPAGCLDEEPSRVVDAKIFIEEQAKWHQQGLKMNSCEGFPK